MPWPANANFYNFNKFSTHRAFTAVEAFPHVSSKTWNEILSFGVIGSGISEPEGVLVFGKI